MTELFKTGSYTINGRLKTFIAEVLFAISLPVIVWNCHLDISRCDGHKCIIEHIVEVHKWGDIVQINIIYHPYKGKRQEVRVENTKKGKKVLDKPPATIPNIKKLFYTELSNIQDYIDNGKQPDSNIMRQYSGEYKRVFACPDRCYCKQSEFAGKTKTRWGVLTFKRDSFNSISYEIWVGYKGTHSIFEGKCIPNE